MPRVRRVQCLDQLDVNKGIVSELRVRLRPREWLLSGRDSPQRNLLRTRGNGVNDCLVDWDRLGLVEDRAADPATGGDCAGGFDSVLSGYLDDAGLDRSSGEGTGPRQIRPASFTGESALIRNYETGLAACARSEGSLRASRRASASL